VCYNCANNGDDENYSKDMCMWDCYAEHGIAEQCMDNNHITRTTDTTATNYLECGQADFNDNNGNSYCIGPYCESQGVCSATSRALPLLAVAVDSIPLPV
jgi:hypothetical protein